MAKESDPKDTSGPAPDYVGRRLAELKAKKDKKDEK